MRATWTWSFSDYFGGGSDLIVSPTKELHPMPQSWSAVVTVALLQMLNRRPDVIKP